MSGSKHRLSITLAQTVYLRDLVKDDLDATELTTSERQQARSLLRKLNELMNKEWSDSSFDPRSTGQDAAGYNRVPTPIKEHPTNGNPKS